MSFNKKFTLLAAGGVSAITAINGGSSAADSFEINSEMNLDAGNQETVVSVHNMENEPEPELCPELELAPTPANLPEPEAEATPANLPEPEAEATPANLPEPEATPEVLPILLPEVEVEAPIELPEVDGAICWEGEAAEGYQVHNQATPIEDGTSYYQVHVGSEGSVGIGLTSRSQLEVKDVPYGTKGMFYNGNLIDGASALETEFGPKIQEGDIIQMAVHKKGNDTSIYFRQNGQNLGKGFTFSGQAELYPTVLLGKGATATFSQVAANYATFGVESSQWKFGESVIKFQRLSETEGKLNVQVSGGNKFSANLIKDDDDGLWHVKGGIRSTMMVEAPEEGTIKNLLQRKISFEDGEIIFTDDSGEKVTAKKDGEKTNHHYYSENFERLIPVQLE
eukprot:GHVP01049726.1.p1 GENE.GHVP01049726.1~~GHVP01049726.1.p1  ORF type:complete len:433 (+),score=99.18 GHVP01049726.1:117-1301(+)